jgi:nitrite reductase/ring-hydroxylating ferredoxin subunit
MSNFKHQSSTGRRLRFCLGSTVGHEGEVLKCPWHGWEFDLVTGASLYTSDKRRLAGFRVTVEDDHVVVHQTRERGGRGIGNRLE